MKKLTLYTQDGCGPCVGLKAGLKRNGVPFELRNASHDEEARAWLTERGYKSTPVLVLEVPDAEPQVMVGVDPNRLKALVDQVRS